MDDDIIPKGSKRRSQVWNHFQITKDAKARCNCCGVQLHFRGSTFNLKRHLENKHKEIDISQMLSKRTKLKNKLKFETDLIQKSDDSEDSFFWADGDTKMENGEHLDGTEDILLDISDQSNDYQANAAKSDEAINAKEELRVVSFDFQEFKNENDSFNTQDKNEETIRDCKVEILRPIPIPKKKIKKFEQKVNEDNDFRETQIFGDFVASQLRILNRKKREKLQILIQRAILDVVCEESV